MGQDEKLTIRQEKFCNKYIECGNASEAYRFAYTCKNWADESVNVEASKLLNNTKVSLRVKQLQSQLQAKSDISKERVLEEFAKIAFSSIADLHNTWIERKEFEALTENQKASIKSISTKTQNVRINDEPVEIEYVKVELHDKLKALESINKMLGYEAPTERKEIITIRYE